MDYTDPTYSGDPSGIVPANVLPQTDPIYSGDLSGDPSGAVLPTSQPNTPLNLLSVIQPTTPTTPIGGLSAYNSVANPVTNPVVNPTTSPVTTPVTTPVAGALTTTAPTLTQAGTNILGPTATVVNNVMYTSDGRMITNPIVSDYQKYGLTAPKNTPVVSPPKPAIGFFSIDPSRRESGFREPSPYYTSYIMGNQSFLFPVDPNPYAMFGRGQSLSQAYLTKNGSIVLPGGYIINNPTNADYEQYGINISDPFKKGSLTKAESSVINQYKIAKSEAMSILEGQIKANGLSKEDADALRSKVSKQFDQNFGNYQRIANLPGSQEFKNFYNITPEQYLNKIPEDQRSLRPTADQLFNSLSEAERARTSVEKIQHWLDSNPDYKITLTPELVKNAADQGLINLGTRLVGWDYEKLGVTDPEQLRALNAAGNKYSMGLNMLNDWGLLQASREGKTRTGFGIINGAVLAQAVADGQITADEIHRYMPNASGRAVKQFTNFAQDMMALRGDNDITLDDLRRITPGGTAPKLIDSKNNIYAVSAVKYKKGDHYILVQKTGDDQYRVVGGTKQFTPTGGGGFWNWAPKIAGIALAAFAPGLGGAIGSAITGATTAGFTEALIGNAILGAIQSGITGGDIGMGALTGGISGGIGNVIGTSLGGLTMGGLPIRDDIINAISSTAGNLATSPLTGADAGDILTGGLINVGANIVNPLVGQQISGLMPTAPPGMINTLSSGLTAAAFSPVTGINPSIIAGSTLGSLGNQLIRNTTARP